MAVLANSISPVYNIETVVFQLNSLSAGFPANSFVPQTGLIYTVQPMPMVLIQQRIGSESDRQSWS